MAEERLTRIAYRREQGWLPGLLGWWPLAAGLAAGAVLSLLLLVLRWAALSHLPDYAAVALVFAAAVVLPGLVLQWAVLPRGGVDPLVRVAVAPGLGLALATPPGFVALELHASLAGFAAAYAVFAALGCGAAVLLASNHRAQEHAAEPVDAGWNPLLAGMIIVVLLGVLTTPLWARGRLSGDFDDWTYMAYARSYLDTDEMNAEEPFLGTGEAVTPRMRDNVWVLMQALVSDASGVPPHDVLLEFLRPLLTVLAVVATYSLAQTLARSRAVGLLAGAFQLGYAFLDVAPHEGFGRNLFLRISEDKMVGAFILFPAALIFVTRFAAAPSAPALAGFALIVLAMAFVHPVPLVFLAIAIVALAALRLATERDARSLPQLGLLLIPVLLASLWPLIQRQLLTGAAPELFGTEDSAITFRDEFRVIELAGPLLIGNYHMIVHPLLLAAILLAPLVWLAAPRSTGHQLLAAMTVAALVVFFVPLFATPLAEIMTPQTLWKVPWMIPVGPILGVLTYEAWRRLAAFKPIAGGALRRRTALFLGPAATVVLLLIAALAVQEQYVRADGGAFYDWTRGSSPFPGQEESIFLGGIDRAFAGDWRPKPYQQELFAYLDKTVPRGAVVLAEPPALNHLIPGILTDVYPVDFGGAAGEGLRREDANAFAGGKLDSPGELEAVIERWGVDFIVVRETEAANDPLLFYEGVELLEEVAPYLIYAVI